jgi:MarR family transcriptional regulator, organic hydroperoxide resistance regulator
MKSEEELRFLVLAAQRQGERTLGELLAPLGLTPAQAEALRCLGDAGHPLTLVGLGKRLVCERGSPSRLVKTLAERGWTLSRENPDNRREVFLTLTPEGQRLQEEVRKVEHSFYGWIASQLDTMEQLEAIKLLRRLVVGDAAGAIDARKASTGDGD